MLIGVSAHKASNGNEVDRNCCRVAFMLVNELKWL